MIEMLRIYSKGFLENVTIEELAPGLSWVCGKPFVMKSFNIHLRPSGRSWRYVTTFKYCYPNSAEILITEYGLKWEDRITAYITKEITTPKFSRYRTRFRKMYFGTLKEYKVYLKGFMGLEPKA